jgi:hypothetical protein
MEKRSYRKLINISKGNTKELIFKPMSKNNDYERKHYDEKTYSEFNSFGYRCENFTKDHDGKHILFMGCSETQGTPDTLDDAWAYILYKKISENEKLSGYYNIAHIGEGITIQLLQLMEYIENFGKPDEIYLLAPESYRTILCSKQHPFYSSNIRSNEENYTDQDFINAHGNTTISLRFLESYCLSSNIKLIWSTWYEEEEDLFSFYGFNNFFSLDMKNIESIIKDNFIKYQDKTKSVYSNLNKIDGHKGLVFHKYWAEKFYEIRQNEK